MDKVIIEARVNENRMRGPNPHIPYLPHEIANDARACHDAGASIVHYHGRNPDGSPDHSAAFFCATNRMIRETSGVLIHTTLGAMSNGLRGSSRFDAIEVMAGDPATVPDLIPMDMGTVNTDSWNPETKQFTTLGNVYHNDTTTLMHFAERSRHLGIKPQLQLWNGSFTRQAEAFVASGLVDAPAYVSLVMVDGEEIAAHPGTVAGLEAHLALLPRDGRFVWTTLLYGGNLLQLADRILGAGGHIAIGIGDYPYAECGLPTNAELIGRIAAMARAHGREPASVDDTRSILGMTGKP